MLGRPERSKLAHAFLWECSYQRLRLAQFLGQLGFFLTLRHGSSPRQVDDAGKSRKFGAGFSLAVCFKPAGAAPAAAGRALEPEPELEPEPAVRAPAQAAAVAAAADPAAAVGPRTIDELDSVIDSEPPPEVLEAPRVAVGRPMPVKPGPPPLPGE